MMYLNYMLVENDAFKFYVMSLVVSVKSEQHISYADKFIKWRTDYW